MNFLSKLKRVVSNRRPTFGWFWDNFPITILNDIISTKPFTGDDGNENSKERVQRS